MQTEHRSHSKTSASTSFGGAGLSPVANNLQSGLFMTRTWSYLAPSKLPEVHWKFVQSTQIVTASCKMSRGLNSPEHNTFFLYLRLLLLPQKHLASKQTECCNDKFWITSSFLCIKRNQTTRKSYKFTNPSVASDQTNYDLLLVFSVQ